MFEFLKRGYNKQKPTSSWRINRWWWPDQPLPTELAVLRVISAAIQDRLAIEPLIRCLAAEHRGPPRRRLKHMADLLKSKPDIVAALEQTPELVRDSTVLTLRHAEQAGLTKQVLGELVQSCREQLDNRQSNVSQVLTYGLFLTLMIGLAASFLMTFISPTFREMFEEFGLNLPRAFRVLEELLQELGQWMPAALIAGTLMCILLLYFKPQRFIRRQIMSRVNHAVAQQRLAELFRMLASALDAGRPLVGSLSTLGRYHFDAALRAKLLFARNEVEQGLDPWQGLFKARLLSLEESRALSKASSDALRGWMMRQLASQYESRLEWRRQWIHNLIHPCIILVLGAGVAWIAVAYFGVLVTMISSLS